jgi:type IV pilus assembly protein PilW
MTRNPFLRGRQQGLTLVELLISVVIGLLVLGALLVVYLGSRAAYRSSDSLARVQESGRFALDFIAQDSRMSGFMGCRSRNLSVDDETLLNITSNPVVPFVGARDGVRGFDGGNSGSIAQWTNATGVTRVGASDVLTIRRAGGVPLDITGTLAWVPGTGGSVTLRHNSAGLGNGDVVALGNCEQGLVFRITNSPAQTGIGNFPTVLEFRATGGGSGGTAGNDTSVPWGPAFQFAEASRAQVITFTDVSYFIGRNAAGRPALYRAFGNTADELVDNVEDMDIVYGIDTNLPRPDGVIDLYRRADQIAAADWGRVASARISLLVAGPEDNVATGAQTYFFRETSGDGRADEQTAPDRRLRHVFTTTISLRNRVL